MKRKPFIPHPLEVLWVFLLLYAVTKAGQIPISPLLRFAYRQTSGELENHRYD
jgi:hypothetical protein